MNIIIETLQGIWESSGFSNMTWQSAVMIVLACVLLYLGIVKKFEPLLLVGIAFGMLLTNLPAPDGATAIYNPALWDEFMDESSQFYHSYGHILSNGGFLDILYIGVKSGIYPSLIFLGVGAMTDFGPMLSNPKSFLLGAAAQFGVYCAMLLAILLGFSGPEAASIGIIGGADGCLPRYS